MRHVIVTGTSQGLGLGIVRDLLEHGYAVSCGSRTCSDELQALLEKYPDTAFWHVCDVADEQSVQFFFSAVAAQHLALQDSHNAILWGLVNNAGVAKEGILASFPNVESDALIQTNLNGALYCARAFLRLLYVQNSPGRIINISSIIASRGYTGLAAYAASKAGLEGLTRALARENGRRHITVNAVAPGYLETEMSSTLSAQKREQIIRRTPLGRLGTVDDVTPVLRFLLSDEAQFITGQTMTIDGGITN